MICWTFLGNFLVPNFYLVPNFVYYQLDVSKIAFDIFFDTNALDKTHGSDNLGWKAFSLGKIVTIVKGEKNEYISLMDF